MKTKQQFTLTTILSNDKGGALVKTIIDEEQIPAIFGKPGQGLYAWCSESQFHRMKWDGKDPIKFGQYGSNAKGGKTPQETIASYTWLTESVVILWAIRFTDENLKKGNAFEVEQKVNRKIGQQSKDGSGRECFLTSIDLINEVVNRHLYGATEGRTQTYEPRPRQAEFIQKAVEHRLNGGTEFLLGAIMRYGKNFAWLNTIRTLWMKRLYKRGDVFMVLTSKPGVFDTLQTDIESHVYFKDFDFIRLKDKKDKTTLRLNPKKITVIAVSTQLAYNPISGKKTRKFLSKFKFKDVFIDECHTGTDTDNFERFVDSLKIDHRTYASGTPFKTAASKGFDDTNSYYYGYVEQQTDKLNDISKGILNDSVTLRCYIPQVDKQFTNNPHFIDDEQFTITKLLSVGENGEFIHGGDVRDFILDVLGKSNKRSKFSPFRLCEGKLDHTVWLLPNEVKVAEAMGKLLKEIAPEYEVIVASGNNTKDITVVHNAIRYNDKTITLTIGRFVEGTTVPEWSGALVFSDTESVEKYFQFIFRVASPTKGKSEAYVFDFSPERTYGMVFELAKEDARKAAASDPRPVLKQWLDCYNVYRMGEGPEPVRVEIGEVLDQIRKCDYRQATIVKTARTWLYRENLQSVADDFASVSGSPKVTISHTLSDNGMEGGKNYRRPTGKKGTKSAKDPNRKAYENIVTIVSKFPALSFIHNVNTVEQIVNKIDDDCLIEMLGVGKKKLQRLLDMDVIDVRTINYSL